MENFLTTLHKKAIREYSKGNIDWITVARLTTEFSSYAYQYKETRDILQKIEQNNDVPEDLELLVDLIEVILEIHNELELTLYKLNYKPNMARINKFIEKVKNDYNTVTSYTALFEDNKLFDASNKALELTFFFVHIAKTAKDASLVFQARTCNEYLIDIAFEDLKNVLLLTRRGIDYHHKLLRAKNKIQVVQAFLEQMQTIEEFNQLNINDKVITDVNNKIKNILKVIEDRLTLINEETSFVYQYFYLTKLKNELMEAYAEGKQSLSNIRRVHEMQLDIANIDYCLDELSNNEMQNVGLIVTLEWYLRSFNENKKSLENIDLKTNLQYLDVLTEATYNDLKTFNIQPIQDKDENTIKVSNTCKELQLLLDYFSNDVLTDSQNRLSGKYNVAISILEELIYLSDEVSNKEEYNNLVKNVKETLDSIEDGCDILNTTLQKPHIKQDTQTLINTLRAI